MKDIKHFSIGFRLNKEEMKKFKFIKKGIENLKMKQGQIPSYGSISKSDVIRECLILVYDYFAKEEYKKIEMLYDLKRSILRDKTKLYEMRNKKD